MKETPLRADRACEKTAESDAVPTIASATAALPKSVPGDPADRLTYERPLAGW